MALRLVYWMFTQVAQVGGVGARDSAASDVELLVLRHEAAVLRRQVSRPRVDLSRPGGAGRPRRRLPCRLRNGLFVRPATLSQIGRLAAVERDRGNELSS